MRRLFCLAVLFVFIFGCGGAFKTPPNPSNPLKRVAILPMKNNTNDVDGPEKVREQLQEKFKERVYCVKPLEEVDEILHNQVGATLGGQLENMDPVKLGKILQVEGILYSTLEDFSDMTTGLYNVRKVSARLKLVNAVKGSVFWQGALGVRSEETSGGMAGSLTGSAANAADGSGDIRWVTLKSKQRDQSALEGLAIGLTGKLVGKMTGTHMSYESKELAQRITGNLPIGPGCGATGPVPPAMMAMPRMKIPKPKMSFPHYEYGKENFLAVMVTNTFDASGKKIVSMSIPIAKAGPKVRMDYDYTKMAQGRNMPPAMSKSIQIHRGDKKKFYILYPVQKKFISYEETEENYPKPEITKTRVKKEVVNGHPTIKYRVVVKHAGGRVQKGYHWQAQDLNNMVIKSVLSDENGKYTMEMKNIVLKTPPSKRFEIPSGYSETDNMMELMSGTGQ